MKTLGILSRLAFCGLAVSAAAVSADPVLLVNGGVLEGASGVIVGGISYDVSFVDGTCASLYNGCNNPSQFIFNTENQALDAMGALSDQVWGTAWGAGNTRGCEEKGSCTTLLPFGVFEHSGVGTVFYYNFANPLIQDIALVAYPGNLDSSSLGTNYVVWTLSDAGTAAVPEPASFGLAALALGIAGVAGRGRRRALHLMRSPTDMR